jgi:hypothetical protein
LVYQRHMSDSAPHNPFSGIADAPLSPQDRRDVVGRLRSTMFVERDDRRGEG